MDGGKCQAGLYRPWVAQLGAGIRAGIYEVGRSGENGCRRTFDCMCAALQDGVAGWDLH